MSSIKTIITNLIRSSSNTTLSGSGQSTNNTTFFDILQTLNVEKTVKVIDFFADRYYNHGESLIPDEYYEFIRQHLQHLAPHHPILSRVGAADGPKIVKKRVPLPFYMGSMDKIKPNKGSLDTWQLRFPGSTYITDKLDGISAMLVYDPSLAKTEQKWQFYKRGEATEGENISYIINMINIANRPNSEILAQKPPSSLCHDDEIFAIRGELIMKRTAFAPLIESHGFKGARQLVNGLLNKKTYDKPTRDLLKLVDFVVFEVVNPRRLTPSASLAELGRAGWRTVPGTPFLRPLTIDILADKLAERKAITEYEMDGLVVYHDAIIHHAASGSNPEWAFAFKMILAEQIAPTTVIEVQWNASKDGFLKPTVVFEPVNIGGTTI